MLPKISNISWITPKNFDVDKLFLSKTSKILQYMDQDFILAPEPNPDAFMNIDATTKKDNFYSTSITLKNDNEYHKEFFDVCDKIVSKFSEKIPVTEIDDGIIIPVSIISTQHGDVITACYSNKQQYDITSFGPFVGRPALIFYRNPTNRRLRIKLLQVYIHSRIAYFPLATKDF